jgi:dethiobiotin synthetase
MRGVLLLGTDTGVGKTALGRGLLHLAHQRGLTLVPFKPVETGCAPDPADAQGLLEAATCCDCGRRAAPMVPAHGDLSRLRTLSRADICPYRFPEPIAPSAAARAAGTTIEPAVLARTAARLASLGDALLVEGAGGVLSPYGPRLSGASLAELLALDVLLVAANRLGTINHTALAVAELRRRGLVLRGIVLVNVTSEGGPDRADNAAEIEASTGIAPLGILRHTPVPTAQALAEHAAADLDLRPLFGGRLAAQTPPAAAAV